MNQREFVQKRLEAHSAGIAGIANDPLVQAVLAMRAADLEAQAAIRAARNRKDDPAPARSATLPQPTWTMTIIRRQAG